MATEFVRVESVRQELKPITLDDFIPLDYRKRIEKEIAACMPEVHKEWILRRQAAMKLWQKHIQNFADELQNDINLSITIDSLHEFSDKIKKNVDYYGRAGSWDKRKRDSCEPSKLRIDNGCKRDAQLQRSDYDV